MWLEDKSEIWKAVKTKAREVRMAEAEKRRKEGEREKKTRRKKQRRKVVEEYEIWDKEKEMVKSEEEAKKLVLTKFHK